MLCAFLTVINAVTEHRDAAEHEHRGEAGDEQAVAAPATRKRLTSPEIAARYDR